MWRTAGYGCEQFLQIEVIECPHSLSQPGGVYSDPYTYLYLNPDILEMW